MDGTLGTSFSPRALAAGIVALVSPLLALVRWVQEKTTVYQTREEMKHSQELHAFIEASPEMLSASGVKAEVQELARVELAKTLAHISELLTKRQKTVAPPPEMAWPRRLLLLYAPRSWTAILLHLMIYALVALGVLMICAFGSDDQTGDFQWSRYQALSHSALFPVVLLGFVFMALPFSLLWFAAHTRDCWDNALPHQKRFGWAVFPLGTPSNASELLARIAFYWATSNIVLTLSLRGIATSLAQQLIAVAAPVGTMLSKPSQETWTTHVSTAYYWIVLALSVPLTYLWCRAEASVCGGRARPQFPHSWRFLYIGSRWKEHFSQLLFMMLLLRIVQSVFENYETHQLLNGMEQTLPVEARVGLMIGSLSEPILDLVLSGILPLYGSYRLGLISYLSHSGKQMSN